MQDTSVPEHSESKMLIAAIYMAVIGPEVFIVQPGFVQGMVQYLGFSEKMAGDIASAEMWGIAVTTVLMTFFAQKLKWRHVFVLSLLVMVAGNLISMIGQSPLIFGMLRFIVGLGAGGLISLSFTVVGMTKDPDKNFGYLIMWVLIYGAIVLLAMPTAYQHFGMEGVLLFFAFFPATGLIFVKYLPTSSLNDVTSVSNATNIPIRFRYMALTSVFFIS